MPWTDLLLDPKRIVEALIWSLDRSGFRKSRSSSSSGSIMNYDIASFGLIFQLIFTNQWKEVKLWEYYLYHFCFWLLSAVSIPTSPGTGQLYTTMTASGWLTEIASNRISHTYTLILTPSLIGEGLLKKRCEKIRRKASGRKQVTKSGNAWGGSEREEYYV